MITKEEIQGIIKDFGQGKMDSGSVEVQVAILTKRITRLTEHFKTHKKDHGGRRGLLKLVGSRKSLLSYLKKKDTGRYLALVKTLGIRH